MTHDERLSQHAAVVAATRSLLDAGGSSTVPAGYVPLVDDDGAVTWHRHIDARELEEAGSFTRVPHVDGGPLYNRQTSAQRQARRVP